MLGLMKLPLSGRQYFRIAGGSFLDRPQRYRTVGVNMAREIKLPCEVWVPTKDFNTPDLFWLHQGVAEAVDAVIRGKRVYVGCMGGRGRTGLFLAIMAKTFGVQSPITYVRDNYYAHAVETMAQAKYVHDYVPDPEVLARIAYARKRFRWLPFNNLTYWPKPL